MTNSSYGYLDNTIRQTVVGVLKQLSPHLTEAGLSAQSASVEVMVSDPAHYTSELRVYFMRGNDLVDAIEFHIFDDGKQMVQASEIREGIEQDVKDVIQRSRQRSK
jgi:hypothetical protein